MSFQNLCEEADTNLWESAYRLVKAKLCNRAPAERNPDVVRTIIEELFPNQDPDWTNHIILDESGIIPVVTTEEVLGASKKVGANKASGPDEIPNKALKAAIECNPMLF